MTLYIAKEELEKYYVKQRLSSRKIAKIYKCAYSTIDRKVKQYGFPVRTLASAHVIYPRKNFSGDLIEKAYLLGFRIGDLRVRKVYKNSETIHIDCGSTKKEQIELIVRLFKSYGRVWVSKPNNKGAIQAECFLNDSFDFLLNANLNRIEPWICKNKKYFASFLAGFTDAEGSIFITQNQAIYSLGNYDIGLLKQIRKFLKRFYIDSPKIVRSVRKGLVASHGYKYNQDYWILRISRKIELLKLFRLISPYLKHVKRLKDIRLARENITLRNKLYGK